VEVLVRAQPDELPVVAPELARSLLHSKVPVWASGTEPGATANGGSSSSSSSRAGGHNVSGLSSSAEGQRLSALTAVLSLSPLTVGDTVIAELYSPHLDQYQRMLILDSLVAAADEMANPRKAPRLAAAGPGSTPKLLPSAEAEAVNRRIGSAAAADDAGAVAKPGLVETSSRRWGRVSLAKQKQGQLAGGGCYTAGNSSMGGSSDPSAAAAAPGAAGASGSRTYRNRFAPVAIRWTSMLLQQCDVRKHGIDLFGRDSLLLGRLLTVLGAFVEAAAATPAVVPLAAGLLELLKSEQVSGHQEVSDTVTRAAIGQVSQQAHSAGVYCW